MKLNACSVIIIVDIVRKFNPNVKGYALCRATEDNADKAWFNVAKPGGTCELVFMKDFSACLLLKLNVTK